MKILNIMLSRDLGGIQQAFLDYSSALLRQKNEVINVISFGASITSNTNFYRIINLGSWDPISVIQLRRIIAKEKPDLIIAHGNRAINFASRANNTSGNLIGVAHNYKAKWLKKCDYVFALTEDLVGYLITQGVTQDRIKKVPNMIRLDEATLSPHVIPAQAGIQDEDNIKMDPRLRGDDINEGGNKTHLIIGTMGRFVKKKGFDIFLTALSLLKARGISFKAVIGGEGEEEKTLKRLAAKLGLNKYVTFIGWVKDKERFFNSIDIFCLPSIHEPFGIILLESMKYGCPIVSTSSEGPNEIINDTKTGMLCNIASASDMADKLELILSNPAGTKELTKNAYLSLVQNYDIKVVGKILHNHLEQILHDIQSYKAR